LLAAAEFEPTQKRPKLLPRVKVAKILGMHPLPAEE
jgi:hypothetical protein